MVATVAMVSSAREATRYYEKDGYYANDDPEHKKGSFWHGKTAEELGLSKQVDSATFHHVLEVHVPDDARGAFACSISIIGAFSAIHDHALCPC